MEDEVMSLGSIWIVRFFYPPPPWSFHTSLLNSSTKTFHAQRRRSWKQNEPKVRLCLLFRSLLIWQTVTGGLDDKSNKSSITEHGFPSHAGSLFSLLYCVLTVKCVSSSHGVGLQQLNTHPVTYSTNCSWVLFNSQTHPPLLNWKN